MQLFPLACAQHTHKPRCLRSENPVAGFRPGIHLDCQYTHNKYMCTSTLCLTQCPLFEQFKPFRIRKIIQETTICVCMVRSVGRYRRLPHTRQILKCCHNRNDFIAQHGIFGPSYQQQTQDNNKKKTKQNQIDVIFISQTENTIGDVMMRQNGIYRGHQSEWKHSRV